MFTSDNATGCAGENFDFSNASIMRGGCTSTGVVTSSSSSVKSMSKEAVLELSGNNPIIRTECGDIHLKHLIEMMRHMADILCSIKPKIEQLEEYPALEKAYLHYQIIERLVREPPTE
jgi:hypothetical protein